jgi:AcrR family transcriptional regulator
MGPKERRDRQRERLREQILDAARELFSAFGYEGVTIRKIAEKIEYAPGTVYLHFTDKDALVRELCNVDFLELAARFRKLQTERDPIRRLKLIGAAYLQFARERPNHYRMMFMTSHPPVAVVERRIEKGNPAEDAWEFLRATVEEAQAAGLLHADPSGPDLVAQVFFAGFHGIAALFLAKSNDPWIDWRPLDEIAERMLYVLLSGAGAASPAAVRRLAKPRSAASPPGKRSTRAHPSKAKQR